MKAKHLIWFSLLLFSCGTKDRRRQVIFYTEKKEIVLHFHEDEFEVWDEPELISLRFNKDNAAKFSTTGSLVYGWCKIVNNQGDTTSLIIGDGSISQAPEHCAYLFTNDHGTLSTLAGVLPIAVFRNDKECDERFYTLREFLKQ